MNLEKFKGCDVLVTGADGFIPSYVCDRLVELGTNVTALVRRNSSNEIKSISHLKNKLKIRWGDITDLSLLILETKNTDIIYHLGAQSHVQYSLHNPLETYQTNTIGTINVLEAGRINDVKRIIHAGSAEVYGKPEKVPITEDHPLVPRSPYAAGKVAADRLMFSYYCAYNLPVVMPRFFGIYGPRQSIEKAIPKFILNIQNNIPPVIYGDVVHVAWNQNPVPRLHWVLLPVTNQSTRSLDDEDFVLPGVDVVSAGLVRRNLLVHHGVGGWTVIRRNQTHDVTLRG